MISHLYILAAAGLSLIAAAGVALGGGSGARAQPVTTIQVGDIWFCSVPSADGVCETTISLGDTVTWNWVGILSHTTTACSGSDFATCNASQGWDSPLQSSGTFTHTFTKTGTFYYKCLFHPGPVPPFMRGKITVASAAEPTLTPTPTPTPTPTAPPAPPAAVQPTDPLDSDSDGDGQSDGDEIASGSDPLDDTNSAPNAVPDGGGAPPADSGTPWPWALVAASGVLFFSSATLLALWDMKRNPQIG